MSLHRAAFFDALCDYRTGNCSHNSRLIMQCYPEAEGGGTALSWPINSARVYAVVASGFAVVTSHVFVYPSLLARIKEYM